MSLLMSCTYVELSHISLFVKLVEYNWADMLLLSIRQAYTSFSDNNDILFGGVSPIRFIVLAGYGYVLH